MLRLDNRKLERGYVPTMVTLLLHRYVLETVGARSFWRRLAQVWSSGSPAGKSQQFRDNALRMAWLFIPEFKTFFPGSKRSLESLTKLQRVSFRV